MESLLIPILVPLAFFATVFGITYVLVKASNREKMALIESGADPALLQKASKRNPYNVFKWGLLLIGIGIGILIGNILYSLTGMDEEAAYFSMIFLFGGLGLTVSYLKRGALEKSEHS